MPIFSSLSCHLHGPLLQHGFPEFLLRNCDLYLQLRQLFLGTLCLRQPLRPRLFLGLFLGTRPRLGFSLRKAARGLGDTLGLQQQLPPLRVLRQPDTFARRRCGGGSNGTRSSLHDSDVRECRAQRSYRRHACALTAVPCPRHSPHISLPVHATAL